MPNAAQHKLARQHEALSSLSTPQRERLAHIDFTLMFKGEAGRGDLIDRFAIAPTQATKDFALYHEFAPANVVYDKSRRLHVRARSFVPLFDYDTARTLSTLCQGHGDGFLGTLPTSVRCEMPHQLNHPDLAIVAAVSEAMYKGCALAIRYVSLSSGETEREIVPHTLIDNGLRWHVRAFDRHSGEFRDFVLTRLLTATVLEQSLAQEYEGLLNDRQWNRFVELELIPHPDIGQPEAIERDYAMSEGCLRLELRAALAGYLLRRWNVDCSPDHSQQGAEYQLALANVQALYGVKNLRLAPGYHQAEPM
ncbi:WYL domain-containing protein [Halomonas sp. I5-271120]|uniref:WYL domain-containing protein n=1 Tax=Halomonas sp. I5-271120 TaxID=3061632 RepID=UPI00271467C3|nr:WYL domain-containing protein [Halomonas sp. I5-271120]